MQLWGEPMTAIDLIAPPVPLPKPRSPVLGPRRKILHFAKTGRARKIRLSPEIEICADAAGQLVVSSRNGGAL
jgi:hypothetical protein